jgi:hypothetical protein
VEREFGTDRSGGASGKSVCAAQYVRMSTEHQKYSTENQAEAMRQYATRRGIEISAQNSAVESLLLQIDDVVALVDRGVTIHWVPFGYCPLWREPLL